jgi:hypothetical protein
MCFALAGRIILRSTISGRWGSEASSECGVEADFVIDPRTNLFDFQPKPPSGIPSSYQIAKEFVDDLMKSVKVERLPTAERGASISTQNNDDSAKTLRVFQMVITWHDGDVHGNRGTTTQHT